MSSTKEERTEKYFNYAIVLIEKNKLIYFDDVAAYLGISRTAFYDHFKVGSDKYNSIKELIEKNKVTLKVSLRNKWFNGDAPATQIALYKLLATDEELERLTNKKDFERIEVKVVPILTNNPLAQNDD